MTVPLEYFIGLATALFIIASYGILTRKNILIIFMCSEILVAAASINFVAFSALVTHNPVGQSFVIFGWILSVADTIIALALFMYVLKEEGHIDLSKLRDLKW